MPNTATPGDLIKNGDNLMAVGDWTLANYQRLCRVITTNKANPQRLDLSGIGTLDTCGAEVLGRLVGAEQLEAVDHWAIELPASRRALLRTVGEAMNNMAGPAPAETHRLLHWLDDLGAHVVALCQQQIMLLGFIGQVLTGFATTAWRPSRWRITSVVAQLQQTGLNALPIVALLTFMVGAVVAFLGATVLTDFGATIYTVNLVAFAFLREFGVLLAAIMLAGRTASAFTAQIGSMKANEELDALSSIGLPPMELLVLPRVLAMIIALPILTFVGILCGLLGGALVCLVALDISLLQFATILSSEIGVTNYIVGIAKAPLFAFVVAVIGCLEGFKVSGSAQSVGEHTTSSVVQSIFMVILIDALAALFLMEMGW
ncbi:MlaE family ABC transporter permease [Halomonas halocynthiae]|uniref:MlaE family ABC transporter permease n=1 Tax=Halomonas halocynthiae TaxID=176290 RepID=UPI00041C7FF1|nr:ABC transporter permease [Halomonas halocynthiae]